MLSKNLEQTLHRALSLAADRKHEYATLEHLLLGLADDIDAATLLRACGVDLDRLRRELSEFLDKDLSGLATERPGEPKPTAGFQRVVQRAAIHVQSSGRDEVTGANVLVALFSEGDSHAVHFLQLQDMTRLDAVNFISHGRARSRGRKFEPPPELPAGLAKSPASTFEPPPELPAQGIGPHVEINPEGVVSFPPAESLDREGNHLPRLRSWHPDLRELARELAASLCVGNVPHPVLSERVTAYANLIDCDLKAIDFRRLYAAGLRLANAAYATEEAISKGDQPSLDAPVRERLESLLVLHGPFILATAAGAEAIAEEERYRRRPAEEERYRKDAIGIATALRDRPDLVKPDVAEQMLGAALEIDTGRNPERSTTAGRAMVRNVMIALAGGAIGSVVVQHGAAIAYFFGMLTVNETIKKTRWFQGLTQSMASKVDEAMDAPSREDAEKFRSGLPKYSSFALEHEDKLRRLADKRRELEFIHRTLDWLKSIRPPSRRG